MLKVGPEEKDWQRGRKRMEEEPLPQDLSLLGLLDSPLRSSGSNRSSGIREMGHISSVSRGGSALPVFFCLNAAWLNEGRCPGGRPSVSENEVKSRKFTGNLFP